MITTKSIAVALRVSPRRVLAIAKSRGVTPALWVGHAALWEPGAVERLRPGKAGQRAKSSTMPQDAADGVGAAGRG